MIFVKICGGLGNQLFQYATARSLADKLSAEMIIDQSWYRESIVGTTPRRFELGEFNIRARTPTAIDVAIIKLMGNRISRVITNGIIVNYRREKHLQFDENVMQLNGNIYLDGYWQSYKYFHENFKSLLNDLVAKVAETQLDAAIGNIIEETNSVAVHIRRGDYVSSEENSKIHGVCDAGYYQRAFTFIGEMVTNPHYFIFSDDPAWAKENIHPPGALSYVSHNRPEQAIQDFLLMSRCNNQIIANSTFSWWAAYLNQQSAKIVIAPTRWYLNKEHSIEDIVPSEWVKL